jgi:hypothetical protein
MTAKRKKKLKRRAEKQKRSDQSHRELCVHFLELLGGRQIVERFPQKVRDLFWSVRDPKPSVSVDPGCPESDQVRELVRKAISAINEKCTESLSAGACGVSYADFISVYQRLFGLICALATFLIDEGPDAIPKLDAELVAELLERAVQFHNGDRILLESTLSFGLMSAFLDVSDIEQVAFYQTVREPLDTDRVKTSFVISIAKSECVYVNIEGNRRQAFRCLKSSMEQAWEPISLTGDSLLLSDNSQTFPVFMQRHAWDRLIERLGIPRRLLVVLTSESLSEPKLNKRNDGSYLLEVRLGIKKVGYFVGDVFDRKFVIKTFLFLTMQGTPESKLLRTELRLTRSDIEFTMLDNLLAFANSDMKHDKALVSLFDKCGCGHLFNLVDLEGEAKFIPGQSKAVRDHLKIRECEDGILVGGIKHRIENAKDGENHSAVEWLKRKLSK